MLAPVIMFILNHTIPPTYFQCAFFKIGKVIIMSMQIISIVKQVTKSKRTKIS